MPDNSLKERVLHAFNYLHENGEISWQEIETTKYIANILRNSNCKVTTFKDCPGVIAEYGNFKNGIPVVGIRADMDALYQEVEGKFKPNHTCGHDAHMAMVLGLLWKLEAIPSIREKIAVKLIFQPAEEVGTGALKMIEEGVTDNVDYLFGIHVRPIQETRLGRATPVIVHGAAQSIRARIIGEDAHAARPHLACNAIEAGAQIINMIKCINVDPKIPHSVKMTTFQAGGKNTNIIPGNASFSLDLRAQTNEIMDKMKTQVDKVLKSVESAFDVEIIIEKSSGIAAAKTDEDAINIMSSAIETVLGEENIDPPLITPGGDDFHFYTIKQPSLKATMVGLGCDLQPGLHHPNMSFDHDALMDGVNILYEAVMGAYSLR